MRRAVRVASAVAAFAPVAAAATVLATLAAPARPYEDRSFESRVFSGPRHYRLFLPVDYHGSTRRYPVIYYFHGHSDRYTLERYDDGKDTVPKIAAFTAKHPVIVVAVDGYVAEHYEGFYGGAPYDVYFDGGKYDFGAYFKEVVSHIDATLRTLPTRRHRATSGLSMGGYMSLYLSARHPEWIGSASSFNPGPEFYAGEPGRRVLWRPKDLVLNHSHTMVRLIRASGDYISQYHELTRMAYARTPEVDFEFRQDEYHRHWATSIEETFAFHLRAFANEKLDERPARFYHANAHARFSVWDWDFAVDGGGAGYTIVSDVSREGLRIESRTWMPDGRPLAGRTIEVVTAPLYRAGGSYTIVTAPLEGGAPVRSEVRAGDSGRLRFTVDGDGRQVSIHGPGIAAHAPVLLPVGRGDGWRVRPGQDTPLPVRVYNPGLAPLRNVRVELASRYPTVALSPASVDIHEIPPGGVADLSGRLRARFTAGDGDYAPARIDVSMNGTPARFDALIAPDRLRAPAEIEVLDGRTRTFKVFRQAGNRGGGAAIERTVSEGRGNGNGILEPGEEATIWVRLEQGLDPFDKGNWYRARVFSESEWVVELGRLEEPKQLEWTGAKELTSLVRLSDKTPPGAALPVVLRNESWSYHYTPDVRYGVEPLYQAFQLHRGHVWAVDLRTAGRKAASAGPARSPGAN